MEKDFKKIVKEKTKDDLIRIVVNKEEYKNELVEAAEDELRLRDKEQTSIPSEKLSPYIEQSAVKEIPLGIYLASILFFLYAPLWFVIGNLQGMISAFQDNTVLAIGAMWNILMSILSIVLGIGILKGSKWGYEWGLGTAIVNILWFGYWYFQKEETMFYAFLILLETIIAVALVINRDYFENTDSAGLESITIHSDNNYVERDISQLSIIHQSINTEKNKLFGGGMTDDIMSRINSLCKTREEAIHLLNTYNSFYKTDLIDDLKQLDSSYDAIKRNVSTFIDLDIIEEKYPHNSKL